MMRVFLLDDHELIRRGLAQLIEAEADLEVVGEAASIRESLTLIPASSPDVTVVDYRLSDGEGIEVCRELRSQHPEIRFLILTAFEDEDVVMKAVMAGADGFLVKSAGGQAILEAIRTVASGRSLLDPAATERVVARLRGGAGGRSQAPNLTPQQEQLLLALADGLTNREIAQRLHLAEKTVRNYVSDLLAKLGMKHRTQAALYAVRRDKGVADR